MQHFLVHEQVVTIHRATHTTALPVHEGAPTGLDQGRARGEQNAPARRPTLRERAQDARARRPARR